MKVKTLLFAGAAALGFAMAPAAANAQYAAIAAGVNGWGSAEYGYSSMESARAVAVRNCRSMGGSCSSSVAESEGWFFSAGHCNGIPYTGASPQGPARAEQIVRMKGAADGNYDCEIWYTF